MLALRRRKISSLRFGQQYGVLDVISKLWGDCRRGSLQTRVQAERPTLLEQRRPVSGEGAVVLRGD